MDKPHELKQLDGLRPLQEAVGGLIESMTIEQPEATIFVNEEGVLMDMPVNRRASLIFGSDSPATVQQLRSSVTPCSSVSQTMTARLRMFRTSTGTSSRSQTLQSADSADRRHDVEAV